jgi:hypothetical protein
MYALVLSAFYAFIVLYLRHYDFLISGDKQSYINYVYSAPIVLSEIYNTGNFFSAIVREPIWLSINAFLGYFLLADSVVNVIVFFASFVSAYLLIINNKVKAAIFYIVLILLLPQILSNYTIHLRQGLAVSIFMAWYYSVNREKRILIPILLPLIHSSFFVVMFIFILSKIFNKLSMKGYLSILFVLSTIISLVFLNIAGLLGTRQANSIANSDVSGLNFIYWLTIFLLIIGQGRAYFHKYKFEISLVVLYLCGYFINPYAGRIFESTLIIVIPIFLYLKNEKIYIALILLISLFLLQYLRLAVR